MCVQDDLGKRIENMKEKTVDVDAFAKGTIDLIASKVSDLR